MAGYELHLSGRPSEGTFDLASRDIGGKRRDAAQL